MTRAATWSNSDGLVVGYGRNIAERQAAAVSKDAGSVKTAKVQITYESTLGASGALIAIPAASIVKNVYAKITTTWAGGTSITFGDGTDTDGWILAASWGTPSAGGVIQGDGAYAIATGTSATAPKEYATATDLYFTLVGTYTAGAADVYVEYV
ncbi:hypothetical protein UFOVP1528_42 [uncultured Caudovirales phage]|uniref:Uncharacterized protein n=1 Tax=uncultured Caudovirales phage TaxID=2100421 RepID=A0A6J5PF48_9CAUD|nr:hypothetical protein UFOVP905_33 [uncultured Caudovirales phage]CAB4182774.1 hypothetical protein UFOVP1080_21 [uncultured Caudovirales phage]CAB4197232.1 hypothetical protein UFOVP1321_9 [uncultured Caudovirales phage]CAB4212315.1 hypothetical protein UFOVP1432_6 [uncultured Caudovirales phage]CAB5227473.1 hypothetical protein UFOVP1528_42 [uncultured Caudovirales phage]